MHVEAFCESRIAESDILCSPILNIGALQLRAGVIVRWVVLGGAQRCGWHVFTSTICPNFLALIVFTFNLLNSVLCINYGLCINDQVSTEAPPVTEAKNMS